MEIKTKDPGNGTSEAQVTAEQARQAIQNEHRTREANCLMAINQALQDHNCRLVPVFVAKGNRFTQTLEIMANE